MRITNAQCSFGCINIRNKQVDELSSGLSSFDVLPDAKVIHFFFALLGKISVDISHILCDVHHNLIFVSYNQIVVTALCVKICTKIQLVSQVSQKPDNIMEGKSNFIRIVSTTIQKRYYQLNWN